MAIAACLVATARAAPFLGWLLEREDQRLSTYDYVVVGYAAISFILSLKGTRGLTAATVEALPGWQ